MSDYIYDNYFGKYRILVPVDYETNDFPRDSSGRIDCNDYYISCRKNGKEIAQISHYGDDILSIYMSSLKIGNRIIKQCNELNIPIFDIKYGDGEVSFRFSADNFDFFATELNAMIQGKNIKPFSIKNLPKSDYKIPNDDLSRYNDIVSHVPEGDKLVIAKLTDEFLDGNVEKSLSRSVERDLRYYKMSRQKKEYVHMKGLWNEYLEYLREKIR